MTLGRRLRGIREARKIPQNKVADDLNISNQVLSNYERDVRDPNTFILKQLAEYYNVTTDYLLGFTDNPTPLNDKDLEFLSAIKDPNLRIWWEELPHTETEKLKALKEIWEAFEKEDDPNLKTWWEELPHTDIEKLKTLIEIWQVLERKDE